jgi:hypothetical protein
MREDEGGAGDVADLAGAGGDVLEGAPATGEQREPAFAEAAQGPLDRVAGAGIDVEFPAAGWLLDRDEDGELGEELQFQLVYLSLFGGEVDAGDQVVYDHESEYHEWPFTPNPDGASDPVDQGELCPAGTTEQEPGHLR